MKRFLFIIILTLYSTISYAQICGTESSDSRGNNDKYIGYIGNGGVFTPRGYIRILVVFVHLGDDFDTNDHPDWPKNSKFPNWYTNVNKRIFYSDTSDFSQNIFADADRYNISNFYYQMSCGKFRLMADYYPDTVVVHLDRNDTWGSANLKALRRIPSSFDWSKYDNRRNRPYYQDSSTAVVHDSILDYVVFCYRFDWKWYMEMPSRMYMFNANGFSETGLKDKIIDIGNGYSLSKSGFTLMTGWYEPIEIFPHEIGHELYNAPHYNGGNGVYGSYFHLPTAGWGMMNFGHGYTSALGWERYVLDWTPQIAASNIPADISDTCDLIATNGIFTLRDFITTGDAIRIKLPTPDGSHQYLWLENHQGISTFDGATHNGFFCGDATEEYKLGLVAYTEEYSHVKEEASIEIIERDNAIRWLSKNGNLDFSYTNTPLYPAPICNWEGHNVNKTYHFFRGKGNPLSGYCVNEFIRYDYNGNNTIENSEKVFAVQIDDEEPTARWMTGSGMQFHEGDKVGMATNPTVRNMPKYNSSTKKMGDYYLNGISFEVLGRSVGNTMRVKVRLDDVAVDRDVRWAAASIVLGDITGDNRPDVDVQPNIKLTIDMSGTPNRHANPDNPNQTTSVLEDFITPTRFACRNGAFFKQEPYSVVEVKNGSTLVLENGSVYEVGDHASLTIEPSATLVVKSGATLRVLGSGHVEVADLAYICVEDGAYIDLVDTVSAVNLMPLAVQGTYSYGNVPQCTCTLTDITEYPLAHGSNGGIYQCNTDRIISSTTYTHDAYECGLNIRAGRISDGMTRPRDVVIDNGTRVVMDAAQSVRLEPGFKVNAGGRLEVR